MFGFKIGVCQNRGGKPLKMDGENNGKPYEQMDDLGGKPLFLETPKFQMLVFRGFYFKLYGATPTVVSGHLPS